MLFHVYHLSLKTIRYSNKGWTGKLKVRFGNKLVTRYCVPSRQVSNVKSLAEATPAMREAPHGVRHGAQAADEDLSWRVPGDDKASDHYIFIALHLESTRNVYDRAGPSVSAHNFPRAKTKLATRNSQDASLHRRKFVLFCPRS